MQITNLAQSYGVTRMDWAQITERLERGVRTALDQQAQWIVVLLTLRGDVTIGTGCSSAEGASMRIKLLAVAAVAALAALVFTPVAQAGHNVFAAGESGSSSAGDGDGTIVK